MPDVVVLASISRKGYITLRWKSYLLSIFSLWHRIFHCVKESGFFHEILHLLMEYGIIIWSYIAEIVLFRYYALQLIVHYFGLY